VEATCWALLNDLELFGTITLASSHRRLKKQKLVNDESTIADWPRSKRART
jgi:hypothetical protein